MDQLGITDNQAAAAAGGMVGGMFATVAIFALVYYIFIIIACWKIFEKAGEPGWKSLIPIYSQYILYKVVGMKKWFWILFCGAFVISFIVSLMGFNTQELDKNEPTSMNIIAGLLYFALIVFSLVISIMNYHRLSKAFGHGAGFTVGLVLLTGVFLLIMGFDKSKFDKKMAAAWIKEAGEA